MKQFILPITLIFILLSCGGSKKTDFGTLSSNFWYSATMPNGSNLYLHFNEKGINKASGQCFYASDKALVEDGSFEIRNSNELIIKVSGEETIYKGKFNVGADSLVFQMRKPEKTDITFIAIKTYSLQGNPNRYQKEIFDDVDRKTVKYGKAKGFYSTKKVKDMNSESYPDIIMSVTKSIAKNLFSEQISLNMDIYQPKGDSSKYRPLIMLIHGGAFIVGDKQDNFQVRLAKYYAKMGYVVASINYRMGYVFLPGAYGNMERCIYKAVQDSRAAIRYMIHHKKEYRIDPDKIFVAGNSAGGFIALKTAFMSDEEAYESTKANLFLFYEDLGCLDCSTNDYKEKIKIDAVVNMWGALTDLNLIDENEHIPTLLIHGDSDRIVPYEYDFPFRNVSEEYSTFFVKKVYGSKPIYEKLQEYEIPSKLITIEGGSHEPQFDEKNHYTHSQEIIQNAIMNFLYERLCGDSIVISGPLEIDNETNVANYSVNTSDKYKVQWIVEGGIAIPLNKSNAEVKIFWLKSSPQYSIKLRIKSKNDILIESKTLNISLIQ